MKKLKNIIFFFLLILPQNIYGNIEGKIVLKVNNEIITEYDIKNKILRSLLLNNQDINQENIDKLKKQSLNFLIAHKLKKSEVDKNEIKINDIQTNNYLNQISSNNIIKLKNDFVNNNLDFDLFKEEIETELKWQKLITQIYSKKIEIDEIDINDKLNKILEKNSKTVLYRLSEIEFLSGDKVQNEKIILNLNNEINNSSFESAAIKFSIASSAKKKGDLGWINEDVLSKEIYDIVSKMSVNQVSNPIIKQESIIILKLTDKKFSSNENIQKDKLRTDLINQKKTQLFNLYSRSHLSKIRNNSLIETK